MAVRALIFGTDYLFGTLKNFYKQAVQNGTIEIIGYAVFDERGIKFCRNEWGGEEIPLDKSDFDIAIVSSQTNFYLRMKWLEENFKIPRKNIIDGRVFHIPHLDFKKLLETGIARGVLENPVIQIDNAENSIYPKIFEINGGDTIIKLGEKTCLINANFETRNALITAGKFSSISWNVTFEAGINNFHNYSCATNYPPTHFDWTFNAEDFPLKKNRCEIKIGNDVWIGRGCRLKSTNPEKPLVIGDGAVVASDSVVVKNIPPYAIVGGNPAKIIKYRFPEEIIAAFLKIKWWDWSADKIYENFRFFGDVEKFIAMHEN